MEVNFRWYSSVLVVGRELRALRATLLGRQRRGAGGLRAAAHARRDPVVHPGDVTDGHAPVAVGYFFPAQGPVFCLDSMVIGG